ncbi:MAG: hypothetical protein ACRDHW_18585 [Ktedonobacteraceae bacterium]
MIRNIGLAVGWIDPCTACLKAMSLVETTRLAISLQCIKNNALALSQA